MTEENTHLEAVQTQPAAKRRTRKAAGASTQKRTARKTKSSHNGAAPPAEESKVETPPLVNQPPVQVANDPPAADRHPDHIVR